MLVSEIDRVRITILVDVVVDDVPGAADPAERRRRLLAVVRDSCLKTGASQKPFGECDILFRKVRAVHGSRWPHGLAEKESRITITRAEFENSRRADGPSQKQELAPDDRSHNGKFLLCGKRLHLAANRISVVVQLAKILLDL